MEETGKERGKEKKKGEKLWQSDKSGIKKKPKIYNWEGGLKKTKKEWSVEGDIFVLGKRTLGLTSLILGKDALIYYTTNLIK